MHVILDPYVIALPSPNDTHNFNYLEYIEGLANWARILARHKPGAYMSERAVGILLESGQYPSHHVLDDLIRRHNIEHVTARDLTELIAAVGNRRPYLEDKVGVSYLVISKEASIIPQQIIERLSSNIAESARDSLFIAALGLTQVWSGEYVCVGSRGPGTLVDPLVQEEGEYQVVQDVHPDSIQVTGEVTLIEKSNSEIQECNIPIQVEFDIIFDVAQIDVPIDWCEIYRDPPMATKLAYERLLSQSDRNSCVLKAVTASCDFVSSIEQRGLSYQPAVLRRVFLLAALAGINKLSSLKGAKLHPVRTSDAADASQCEREDGSKLWRCMVTQRGAGYRLHYWTSPNGSIELSQVLLESEV